MAKLSFGALNPNMNLHMLTVDAVKEEIIDYLSRHRGAVDTLHGIAQWWLIDLVQSSQNQTLANSSESYSLNSVAGIPLNLLETALKQLTAEGRLESRRLADGSVIYFFPRAQH